MIHLGGYVLRIDFLTLLYLISDSLFPYFFKYFKCRLFNKIPVNLQKMPKMLINLLGGYFKPGWLSRVQFFWTLTQTQTYMPNKVYIYIIMYFKGTVKEK